MLKEPKNWQLQSAKAHFSHLVDLAEKGETVNITRHGHEVVVLISKKYYDKLTKKKKSLLKCFLDSPYQEIDLDLTRSHESPRDIDLEGIYKAS